jgi:YgiT-type zinc finger domain-containing protein
MEFDGSKGEDGHPETAITCRRCSAGVMRLRYITHITWMNEELITVPNFPAWVCDICGRRRFDPRAVSWLNMLLNPASRRESGGQPRFMDELPRSDSLQS